MDSSAVCWCGSCWPAATALRLFSNIRFVVIASACVGAVSAFLGYWLSFAGDYPTGACTVLVIFLFYASTWLIVPAARLFILRQNG